MWKYSVLPIVAHLAIIVKIDIQIESFVEFIFLMGQKGKANSQNIIIFKFNDKNGSAVPEWK